MEVAEWLSLSGQTAGGGPSGVELVRRRLVEDEVWDGLGLSGIEGRGLVEEEISDHASRGAPGRARARWAEVRVGAPGVEESP